MTPPPDNMNLVISQVPNVEKMQAVEQQQSEQAARHNVAQEAKEHRRRTETVPTSQDAKEGPPAENEGQGRGQGEKGGQEAAGSDQDQETAEVKNPEAGLIVDVVI